MKQMLILPLLAGIMATSGCTPKSSMQKSAGLDLTFLDTTVTPQSDFYQYACGGWMANNPLKPEFARYGSFDQLRENNQEQIKILIEELGKTKNEKGSVAQKIGDLYNQGLDSVRLNKEGVAPVAELLKEIKSANGVADYSRLIARLQKMGSAPFFYLFVDADAKNSSMNIVNIYQAGMNMGDRDYYLLEDEPTVKIREAYKAYIVRMFELAGYTPAEAKAAQEAVMKIETALAKAAFSREEERDPYKNYNKLTVEDLKLKAKGVDWDAYLAEMGIDSLKEINLMQLPFMMKAADLVKTATPAEMKDYLSYNVLNMAGSYLSDDFVAAEFDFYEKTMSGKEQQKPRWKRSLDVTSGALPEAVGQLYVAKYFPPQAKERMVSLVNNLSTALGQRIDGLEWMSDTTKIKAKEKLATIHVKIGYPDKWRDYTALNVNPENSYWNNVRQAQEFEYDYMLSQLGKPVDKEKWHMSPQTVNAYYNPSSNEICFPAGILQPPFFYLDADDAVNYGAIGVVIGHEMTHGFDDQGRQFDKDGNLTDWWTADDARLFEERTKKLVDHYNNIVVLDTVHANGSFTLGENIADQGGLQVAYTALQNSRKDAPAEKIDGFTPEQRFFLAYAALWAGNVRDAEILRLTKIDPHSLGKWRVNGALPNIDPFYDAFGITEKDAMYLAPEKRVVIW